MEPSALGVTSGVDEQEQHPGGVHPKIAQRVNLRQGTDSADWLQIMEDACPLLKKVRRASGILHVANWPIMGMRTAPDRTHQPS
jgi:hypothetical protein